MKILIVGSGLAGICLAHELQERNLDFKIIDKNDNYSTKVAAGMINPMTFRRMIKTWRGDELIPVLEKFYRHIETKINSHFLYPIKIRRAFSTEHERGLWENRTEDDAYAKYVNPIESKDKTPSYCKNEFGTGVVNSPGYVEARTFLRDNHTYFKSLGKLAYSAFDFSTFSPEEMTFDGEKYTHIIFAEGARGENNPYFNYLPFKNAKGEVLTIASAQFRKDEILNRKCFILPTQDGQYRLGSTYAWGTDDPSPTIEGKQELLEMYDILSDAPIEVVNHEAGIRPVAADRRPFIGEHPTHKGLYIFNAMGAKGFMIAPFFSIEFVQYLLGEKALDKEVNIQRYLKRFNQ